MEVSLAPHPRPPHSLHTGSIFGERHQVGAVCRGQLETFSACFGDAAGGRGGAVLRAAGKTFYGQDPETLPYYPDLGLFFNERKKGGGILEFGPTKEPAGDKQATFLQGFKIVGTWLYPRHYEKAFLSRSALLRDSNYHPI